MANWKDTGVGAHTAGQDIEVNRRVDLNVDNELVYATGIGIGIGIAKFAAEDGKACAVGYWNKPGTMLVIAAGAIDEGDEVYAAASGKVQALPAAAGTYVKIGLAFSAADEDGDYIEVYPMEVGKETTVTE